MRLPTGTPMTLEEAEFFIKSRDNRKTFNGLVQMHGITSGKEYLAELLMTEGEVIAIDVSIEDGKTLSGDSALDEVKKLGGSEGDLKLIKYTSSEVECSVEQNKNAILEKRLLLEEFKIKIKPFCKPTVEGGGMLNAVKGILSVGRAPPKGEFKGQFRMEPIQTKERVDIKKELINKIKNRRFGRLTEKLLSRGKPEEAKTQKFAEGEVVETTIDKLFNLVDKRNKLKINDSLAKELGVSKERIEEWAVILEEHNLVSINYPTIGEPEIVKKGRK